MKKRTIGMRLAASGVLLITVPFLLKHWVSIPDFFSGFLAGLGITLAIGGLFVQKLNKKSNR